MATMLDLVNDARRIVYGSMNEQINLAAANATAGADTLTLELDVDNITIGSVISSGLNVWFVKSVDVGTKQIGVIPGYDGSPQGAVTSGDVVYIRPRATAWYLFSTMCDVIRSMSAPGTGLYKIGTWTADTDAQFQTYEVPAAARTMSGLLGARVLSPGTDDVWLDIPSRALQWQSSQNIIRCTRALPSGTTIEFRYKGIFTVPTGLSSDPIADVGLVDSMLDIPPLGTAVALLRTTEARRGQVQTQGDPRRAAEVQAGSNATIARELDRDYKARVGEEALRLVTRNPYRQDT